VYAHPVDQVVLMPPSVAYSTSKYANMSQLFEKEGAVNKTIYME
jgi:hypothetical protein